MSEKIELELDEKSYERIQQFKNVFEKIIEEEADVEECVMTLLSIGLQNWWKDIIPTQKEVLQKTIQRINMEEPAFFSKFVIKTLEQGEAKKRIDLKNYYK